MPLAGFEPAIPTSERCRRTTKTAWPPVTAVTVCSSKNKKKPSRAHAQGMCVITAVVQNWGKVRLNFPPPPPTPVEFQNYEKLCKFSGSSFEAVELKDEKRKAKRYTSRLQQ